MTIEFADGTVVDGVIGLVAPYIILTMSKENAQAHFFDFVDETKTSIITFHSGVYKTIYHWYTAFESLTTNRNGDVQVMMRGVEGCYVEDNVLDNPAEYYGVPAEYLPEELRGETNQNGSNNGQSD